MSYLLAFLGFIYIVIMRPKSVESIRLALVVVAVGSLLYLIRRRTRRVTESA